MPTTTLSTAGPAHLPTRPVILLVERDGTGAPIDFVVSGDVDVRRPRPDMLIIPRVDRSITVSLRPSRGGVFETPTLVHLTAMVTDAVGGDHERIVVPSIVLSGLPVADVLTLEPRGHQVAVRRPVADDVQTLPPVGQAALRLARGLYGATRVADDDTVDLSVVVDASASMAASLTSGVLRFVLDLLTGLPPVLGRTAELQVAVATPTVQRVAYEPVGLSTEVENVLRARPLRTGFVGADVGIRTAPRAVTYLVTDGPVADQDSLIAVDARVHALVMAADNAAAAVSAMSRIPVTVIDPELANSWAQDGEAGDDARLRQVIRSLASVIKHDDASGEAQA